MNRGTAFRYLGVICLSRITVSVSLVWSGNFSEDAAKISFADIYDGGFATVVERYVDKVRSIVGRSLGADVTGADAALARELLYSVY